MRVSDRELLSRIESLARKEHATTIEILLNLNEVEQRRLHLTLGYGSMFDFAVKHLRYRGLIDAVRGQSQETVDSARSYADEGPAEPQFAEPQFKVQFAAGPAFMRKLEEARAILSSRSPGVGLEEVLEAALDAYGADWMQRFRGGGTTLEGADGRHPPGT